MLKEGFKDRLKKDIDFILFGGEFGFDRDIEAEIASRCRQTTLKMAN